MKNASLKQIALIAASILSVFGVIVFAIVAFVPIQLNFISISIIGLLTFALSYLIFYQLIDGFVYRRIKVLYKNIHHLKSGKAFKEMKHQDDPLSVVEQQVNEFSVSKSSEIAQLKQMEQFRREFLGDVSHELKTPIFNTQGYIETLLNGAIDNPAVNTSYLKKASANLDRLSEIVDNLLKIAETEVGNLQVNTTKFDIIVLIKEVIDHLEMMADSKEVRVEIKKESPSSKMVLADRKLIETVLNNLLVNAIKYGNEEGKILFGVYDMDKNILIEISDNGPGIEEKHLPRLFDRFYRIDKHRSRFDGGNGLGLSICKHIIEAHEQSIHVRSTVNVGSTFGFTLKKA